MIPKAFALGALALAGALILLPVAASAQDVPPAVSDYIVSLLGPYAPIAVVVGLTLAACSTDQRANVDAAVDKIEAELPTAFKHACAAVAQAHGVFVSIAPTFEADPGAIKTEAAIFATLEPLCADPPPADLAAATFTLLGGAAQ